MGVASLVAIVAVLAASCAQTVDPGDVWRDFDGWPEIVTDGDVPAETVDSTAPPCGTGGACSGGQKCCPDNRCYMLTNDPLNCGECGKSCYPKGNMCIAGNCSCNGAASCTTAGLVCCTSGGCLDPMFDSFNCGACGVRCNEDQQCVGGSCGGSCETTGCPAVPHGTASCRDGLCVLTFCEEGWTDGDGDWENGCECAVTTDDNGGRSCAEAYDLGDLNDREPGASVVVQGFCSDAAPEDWYRFDAVDEPDTSCDNFHVAVKFLSNPGRAYLLDVTQASCTTGTKICENDTEFETAMDTRQGTGSSAWGECPCKTTPDTSSNLCSDNSATFLVRVKRAPGTPDPGCNPYSIEISNGKYSYAP